jgi:hypothetical protein
VSSESVRTGSFDLVLFGTDHCTLCEEALELLFSMPELAGRSVRVVDVAGDDRLMEAYGATLPVLQLLCKGREETVHWPFDRAAVIALLAR